MKSKWPQLSVQNILGLLILAGIVSACAEPSDDDSALPQAGKHRSSGRQHEPEITAPPSTYPTPHPEKLADWLPTQFSPSLTVVTFEKQEGDEPKKKVIVTLGANLIRYDLPDDRLRVIYNPKTQRYLGLEISDGTYWTFSWPAISKVVASSNQYNVRLKELTNDGLDNYSPSFYSSAPTPAPTPVPTPTPTLPTTPVPGPSIPGDNPNAVLPPSSPSAGTPDDPNSSNNVLAETPMYMWHPAENKSVISGVACTLWIGTGSNGDTIQAWCTRKSTPEVDKAFQEIRAVNEPMAIVPIRELVPPLVFGVYDQLHKSRITPIQIHWGAEHAGNTFTCWDVDSEKYSPKLFGIPNAFRKTVLTTLDGFGLQDGDSVVQ